MTKAALYSAFNARWLAPEDVARRFVPLPQYSQLIRTGHAVLMGPRGCGKTTLLKMLTRRALRHWRESPFYQKYRNSFTIPDYESIYIPSDIRWSYELRQIDRNFPEGQDARTTMLLQRIMVSINSMWEVTDVVRVMLEDAKEGKAKKKKIEELICGTMIQKWGLRDTIPSFLDIKNTFQYMTVEIRGMINLGNRDKLNQYLETLPKFLFAHILDGPIQSCNQIAQFLPGDVRPSQWAICYDELEIAPKWMQTELLSSLRSIDQAYFLKLTWSPIWPKVASLPESASDFTLIRLWNSHVKDPEKFCEELTQSFLDERFPNRVISPTSFLGNSIFTPDETLGDEQEYARGKSVYNAMVALAKKDKSFRALLDERHISPHDPVPSKEPEKQAKQLDSFFRKAKPIVLLREAFIRNDGGRRSRKSVTIYSGKQALYAVSEGNPRWLLGLLNDLCDSVDWGAKTDAEEFSITARKQAPIISAASRRYIAQLRATPIDPVGSIDHNTSIFTMVEGLALFFQSIIYGEEFELDPVGSFVFSGPLKAREQRIIERAVETGAFVYIGDSKTSVPSRVTGERFRLSFMICPAYKLPLRNYRRIVIKPSEILTSRTERQMELAFI